MDSFSVSVKGVLELDGKLLLRKNERQEFELLGGHLEKEDVSAEQRLITEFLEESGISVEVGGAREPWLYEIGAGEVLIVPFVCRAAAIPERLFDRDGGTLHWAAPESLSGLPMPQGYKDTILGITPRTSHSDVPVGNPPAAPAGQGGYYVMVCVCHGREVLGRGALKSRCAPGDFARTLAGEWGKESRPVFRSSAVDQARSTIILNYAAGMAQNCVPSARY
ncbi:MAG: hypothetical protein K6E38_06890 [Fretibacterium sp.]|nr:hypothetical protein [Fretibacterium sp.]